MSQENERQREGTRPIFGPETEEQFLNLMEKLMNRTNQISPGFGALPTKAEKIKLSKEDEKAVDKFMKLLDSEIEKYAKDLIRNETKAKILSKGQEGIKMIKQALKLGKKPKLKRKKGCIFIQLGEGTPDDPIDEMLIANTGI